MTHNIENLENKMGEFFLDGKRKPDQNYFQSESGVSTPLPLPDVFTQPAHKHPGLDTSHGSTGVIWATEQAEAKGYKYGDTTWSNLGQGSPETTPQLPGGKYMPAVIDAAEASHRGYESTAGSMELREAVANLYNKEYRQGMESQYTAENVCIVPGGRAGLIRIASILRDCYLSFFFPDYTAYAEMLSLFKNFAPIPVPLDDSDNYSVHLDIIQNELNRGVTAMITSNPRNPTGQSLKNEDLKRLHDMCRKTCLLIMDEFYSHYIYDQGCDGYGNSSAAQVIDVNADPVLILDGMTKAMRRAGWRVAWIVGPKSYIKSLASAGSFLDGGTVNVLQKVCVPLLEPDYFKNEMVALQKHFKMKRDYCINRLTAMGFKFKKVPTSTFYIWLSTAHLPGKLRTAFGFFQACLEEHVITVPGPFFDINPAARRDVHDSPLFHYVRLSYGPPMDQLKNGMDGIQRVIERYRAGASILPKR